MKLAGFPVLEQQEASAFATRVAKLLERVEYRRADSDEDKEAIYRLRYEAYRREGSIAPNSSGLFSDPEDETANVCAIGIFVDGKLASSIRLHIASQPEDYLPVSKVFPDIISPHLEAGSIIIDATRLCIGLEFLNNIPYLPYVTMRSAFVAANYFGADYIVAALRKEHQGAYRRVYGAKKWSDARTYPFLTKPQVLMAYEVKNMWQITRERYPFFQSTPEERVALFAPLGQTLVRSPAKLPITTRGGEAVFDDSRGVRVDIWAAE